MHAFLKGAAPAPAKAKADKPGSSGSAKPKKNVPWVEKYRPNKMDDVAHQDEVVAVLKKSMSRQDLPNLLFYGPPGTGKTSTILAASKELFGEIWRDRVLELNASDERGINVVREKVKNFAQLTAGGQRPDGKPCPSFKIIILDEADSMTKPAQAALRRTMEKQSKTTRFCLICNYVSRIIEPITSRCAKFRFKPVARDILITKLNDICEKESVQCDKDAIDSLLDICEGDMRKAITYLQSVSRLKREESVSKQDIYDISGVIPEDKIDELVKVCRADSYEKLEVTVKDLMAEGHSGTQIITQLHDKLMQCMDLTDKQKAHTFERLAIVDKRLMDGADEYLQIMDVCTVLMYQICHGER